MEVLETVFSDLLENFLLLFPQRIQSRTVSRDFWMPDESGVACYECEIPFTLFNRRHHCRICGRIFCGKCTQNTVPTAELHPDVLDKGARVRVCDFCFKVKYDKEYTTNGPDAQSSSSFSSLSTSGSAKLSADISLAKDSSNAAMLGSKVHSIDKSAHQDGGNFVQTVSREFTTASDDFFSCRSVGREAYDTESTKTFAGMHSSDEVDNKSKGIDKVVVKSENLNVNCINHPSRTADVHVEIRPMEAAVEMVRNPSVERSLSQRSISSSDDYEGRDEDLSNFYVPSLISNSTSGFQEFVDLENNASIWVPPPPQDETEERALRLVDDDDEDGNDWSNLDSTLFGIQQEENVLQEQKKARKDVMEGHFRALVLQLLAGEGLDTYEGDKASWLEIITTLASQTSKLIKPDTNIGGMDPGAYVKVMCIASGQRTDSRIIKGVVCKRNVAHRRMAAHFKGPKILLLSGALEYQRIPNMFSSLETLLQQEKEHIAMTILRIEAHHPNVVLVEKNVSGQAQEILLSKGITLVSNIKRALLEHIARCTGAEIVSAPEQLMNARLGYCDLFHVEKFIEELGSAGQPRIPSTRTLMFFEGCPRPLGCTVLLKGASEDELKKVKRVVQFAIFAAYQLAVETSFLVDEGVNLSYKSPISVVIPEKHFKLDRSLSTISIPSPFRSSQFQSTSSFLERDAPKLNGSVSPLPVTSSCHSSEYSSPIVSPPGHQTRTDAPNIKHSERRKSIYLAASKGQDSSYASSHNAVLPSRLVHSARYYSGIGFEHLPSLQVRCLKQYRSSSSLLDSVKYENLSEMLKVDDNGESDRYLSTLSLEGCESNQEDFGSSPSDQSILVLFSSACLRRRIICESGELLRIKYYGNFDKPLGKFLMQNIFDLNNGCRSCGEMRDTHIHRYMHRQGSLTISVRRQEQVLLGEREGKIWMWHRCLICPCIDDVPPATHRILMSDAAWRLSFGKFLELTFSNHAAAGRVASCGHSLHRDCLRFYGFGNMVACFKYSPINVYAVCLPPFKLTINSTDPRVWLYAEQCEVIQDADTFFTYAFDALHVVEREMENCGIAESPLDKRDIIEFGNLLRDDQKTFFKILQSTAPVTSKGGHLYIDILQLNAARRHLAIATNIWSKKFKDLNHSLGLQNSSSVMSCAKLEKSPTLGRTNNFSTKSSPNENLNTWKVMPEIFSESYLPVDAHMTDLYYQETASACSGINFPLVNKNSSHRYEEIDRKNEMSTGTIEGTDAGIIVNGNELLAAHERSETVFTGEELLTESNTLNILFDGEESFSLSSDIGRVSSQFSTEINNTRDHGHCSHSCDIPEDFGKQARSQILNMHQSWSENFRKSSSAKFCVGLQSLQTSFSSKAHFSLPLGVHNTVIPVYDDEPTSIIAYAIMSHQYQAHLYDGTIENEKLRGPDNEIYGKHENFEWEFLNTKYGVSFLSQSKESLPEQSANDRTSFMNDQQNSKLHMKVVFTDDQCPVNVKYMVICYYARQFELLRKTCCNEMDFIRSLCLCKRWGAQGGKSNVFFAKTNDDRFVIKQVTKTELESFVKFAPGYFRYVSESLKSGSPTCLAKILGIFQVSIKHMKGGREIKMDLMIMENLLYGRQISRLFDLKGSLRSRYNQDKTGKNKVMLDENLVESMLTDPIFIGNKAKRRLERAIWNDTSFLASIDVMDYSLLVGVDEECKELVLGIIDFMRQYTWDKHLETWVKASGILGGARNASPTVISPKQYKKRFRKAMKNYFLVVPDQWSPTMEILCPSPIVDAIGSS